MIFRKNKPNKYGNKKVEVDGLLFDSKKEMQRYLVLKDAERNGVISDLKNAGKVRTNTICQRKVHQTP